MVPYFSGLQVERYTSKDHGYGLLDVFGVRACEIHAGGEVSG